MSDAVKVGFVPFSTAHHGVVVVFCGAGTGKAVGTAADTIKATNQYKGKSGSTLSLRIG